MSDVRENLGKLINSYLERGDLTPINYKEDFRIETSGRFVLLDFWTSCCIDCIEIMPTIEKIETALADFLDVVGIHAPKFSSEKNAGVVSAAVSKYKIAHPVINDPDYVLWKRLGIRGWPTLLLITPDGREVLRTHEPDPTLLLTRLTHVIQAWGHETSPQTLPAWASGTYEAGGRLSFPSKVTRLPGAPSGWVVADSGHNQIVEFDASGNEKRRYGRGDGGFLDGTAETACFSSPQGVTATKTSIFVADTGNHALRRIDRCSSLVATIAGTGVRGPILGPRSHALSTGLASPWDIALADKDLIFSNAGTHQLGIYYESTGEVARLAGDGREALIDGPAEICSLAQPSGLAIDQDRGWLYFVDSETSSLRRMHLGEGSSVTTLIGHGLFTFGDRSGSWEDTLLQHPLGISVRRGKAIVADTYNDKLKLVDLGSQTVIEMEVEDIECGGGQCRPLYHPSSVEFDGDSQVVFCDTNNHRVLVLDTLSGRCYALVE